MLFLASTLWLHACWPWGKQILFCSILPNWLAKIACGHPLLCVSPSCSTRLYNCTSSWAWSTKYQTKHDNCSSPQLWQQAPRSTSWQCQGSAGVLRQKQIRRTRRLSHLVCPGVNLSSSAHCTLKEYKEKSFAIPNNNLRRAQSTTDLAPFFRQCRMVGIACHLCIVGWNCYSLPFFQVQYDNLNIYRVYKYNIGTILTQVEKNGMSPQVEKTEWFQQKVEAAPRISSSMESRVRFWKVMCFTIQLINKPNEACKTNKIRNSRPPN